MISRKQVKFIKSLKIKKFRGIERSFLVEGFKNVSELIQSDFTIRMIVGTEQFFQQLGSEHKSESNQTIMVTREELESLGTFQTNEDGLAVAEMKDWSQEMVNWDDHIFLMDGLSDPGNMGTIIRTLDWFGYNQLICSPGS